MQRGVLGCNEVDRGATLIIVATCRACSVRPVPCHRIQPRGSAGADRCGPVTPASVRSGAQVWADQPGQRLPRRRGRSGDDAHHEDPQEAVNGRTGACWRGTAISAAQLRASAAAASDTEDVACKWPGPAWAPLSAHGASRQTAHPRCCVTGLKETPLARSGCRAKAFGYRHDLGPSTVLPSHSGSLPAHVPFF